VLAPIAELIIETEKSDFRFELFAKDICECNEGVTLVPTSQSWDLGRDARSTAAARGTHRHILCATLNKDIDQKVEADLLRVTATSSPDRLIYCSSQRLSEHQVDEITKIIRRHSPSGSVLVLGSIQLSSLSEKYPGVFEKYYHAELQTINNSLMRPSASTDTQNRGLRLALIAVGSEDAAVLRNDIMRTAVLDFLNDGKPHALSEIVEVFSRDLGLSRPVRGERITTILRQEERQEVVRVEQNKWVLTEYGRQQLEAKPIEAATHLLQGRELVRDALQQSLGNKIDETLYDQIWSGLLDFLAGLFYTNGLGVIRAVERFLFSTPHTHEDPNIRALFFDGIARVSSVVSAPDLRESVAVALLDMFSERSGPAFDWLTKVSERFVILCALGLESTSAEEVRMTLRMHQLVPDTDILLSYLCQAEPDHGAAVDLFSRWLEIGGAVLLSPVVLEEVAYHAWISERDYQETEYLLGKLKRYELRRYIGNAFVRTYHSFGERSSKRWPMFIGQFRGNARDDYSKIRAELRRRLRADLLPVAYEDRLKRRITDYLMTGAREGGRQAEVLEDISYKIERDGQLLASIPAARAAQEKAGQDAFLFILSSSSQLRKAEEQFHAEIGDPRVVVSIAALSYIISMVPDSGMSADTLRRALFEFGGAARLRDTGRRALRVIRATEEYDIPWGTRTLLQHELNRGIRREAEKLGVDKEVLQQRVDAGESDEIATSVISDALKQLAMKTALAEQLGKAEAKISKLEAALKDALQALRSQRTRV